MEGRSRSQPERVERERGGEERSEREREREIKGGSVMVPLLVGRARTTYKYRGARGWSGEWCIVVERGRERRWDKMGRP